MLKDHVVSKECTRDVEASHPDDKGWVLSLKHVSSDAERERTAAVRIINNEHGSDESRGQRDE